MGDNEFKDTLAERATELFKLCDHQGKGYITEEDLALVTEELGLPLTPEQITATFTKLDKDNNNYLTLAEFISGFDLFLGAQDGDESSFQAIDYSQGHQLFDLCDRERKGYIIKSDLERLAGEFQLTEQQLGDLFHSLDQDNSGYLTLEEFVTGFGKFLAFESNALVESDDYSEQFSPAERIYESHQETMSPEVLSEDAIFEKIADKVGDDLLSGMLSKGQLHELWKAMSSNEVIGFEKLTEFLTKVSQEIKRSRTQALNVEQILKGQVDAHEMEIQKLYEKMDMQLKTEKQDISSHHEKKEKQIREQFQNEMELKEQELQLLLNQQKELEKKIEHLNQAEKDVRDENNRLVETNYHLQSKLDESSSSLEDTKSYLLHLQSFTVEERKERARTAMTIAQGMQKEHESLIKQLDLLREVNQKLRDQKDVIEAAHEQLEQSPTKSHKTVTRQGSAMSKYFGTFDGHSSRTSSTTSRLSSVNEARANTSRPISDRRKLHRTHASTQSIPSPLPGQQIMVFADEADGAEFESDKVFEDGELKGSERPEWLEKVHAAVQPVMNEAQRKKTEQEFRKHKMNMVPQLTVKHDSSATSASPKEEDGKRQSPDFPLSPRTSPVGTETEIKTDGESLLPESSSYLQRVYKVVFVGDSGVGKSSFIHRYCYEIWKPSYTATIGVDFQVKSLQIERKKLALQLWDTAGQERFRSITKQYFRKADGVVLLYDLTSEVSFVDIKSWMASVEEAAEPGCTVMLIGNKLDLCKEDDKVRAVTFKDAEQVAEEYGILYEEASAKTGENVNKAMETLARKLQEQEDWQLHSVLNLKLDEGKKKKSCCGR